MTEITMLATDETDAAAAEPEAARRAARPLLSVRGLSKRFDIHHINRVARAFDEVSFDLEPGAFLMVEGANGVGKSTLLRTIYRTCLASSGSVIYQSARGAVDLVTAADIDVAWLRRAEIGFVTQFLQARPRVTAEELVAEEVLNSEEASGAEHGAGRAEALEAARGWLDAFGLKRELWSAYPTAFSGGEQQKVNLARALIRPRRLLLLDEPTASLDRGARQALAQRLEALKRAGVALIGVFHFPEDVAHLVDRRVTLENRLQPAPSPA